MAEVRVTLLCPDDRLREILQGIRDLEQLDPDRISTQIWIEGADLTVDEIRLVFKQVTPPFATEKIFDPLDN